MQQIDKLIVLADCGTEDFSGDFSNKSEADACSGDFDLSCLPSSLKELRLSRISLGKDSFEDLKCLHLSKLECHPLFASTAAMCSLLVQLPKLKVILQPVFQVLSFSLCICASFCKRCFA